MKFPHGARVQCRIEEGVNNIHNLCLVEGPQVGDILVDRDGLKRKVLARLESLVFISVVDNYEKAGSFCTTQEIKSVGWKVESQPVPEPRVLTMNEIAEKVVFSLCRFCIEG